MTKDDPDEIRIWELLPMDGDGGRAGLLVCKDGKVLWLTAAQARTVAEGLLLAAGHLERKLAALAG